MPILDAYTFHGLSFKLEGKNAKAECPFCGKENHFFVQVETGVFNCRKCGAEGNLYTFLQKFHETAVAAGKKTARERLEKFANDRLLNVQSLQAWGVAPSPIDPGSYLIPIFNLKGKVANLARVVRAEGKWKVLGTTTCKLYPFGIDLLQKKQTTLWVCEGPWDAIALWEALRSARPTDVSCRSWVSHKGEKIAGKTHGVIGVPGAGTFPAEWLQLFAGRDVRLVYDNDHPKAGPTGNIIQPGYQGQQTVLKRADTDGHAAEKIQYLIWGQDRKAADGTVAAGPFDASRPSGYDVRDLIRDAAPPAALTYLCQHLHLPRLSSPEKSNGQAPPESVEPIPCETFDELCGHFRQHLHFTGDMQATLAVALSVVSSTSLGGEQLFFRIIGPPGSGKTTIAECLAVAREHCFPKSILTGFHSGFTGGPHGGGPKRESSLIPEMDGKCVIIKDADTLLNSSQRDRILAELRDIYDGVTRSHYRTGKKSDYENLRTTFLLCGTDALRGLNRSFLGERFLDIDILGTSTTGKYLDSALDAAFAAVGNSLIPPDQRSSEARGPHSLFLKQVTCGFLNSLVYRIKSGVIRPPTHTNKVDVQIKAMAQLLAITRARVEHAKEGLAYRPRAELGTRLTKQFAKLVTCLAITTGCSTIDASVMDIAAKVLWDTAHGYPLETIAYLYTKPKGDSTSSITSHMRLSETQTRRVLDDMLEIGSLTQDTISTGFAGRNAHKWHISAEIRELYRLSNLPKVY